MRASLWTSMGGFRRRWGATPLDPVPDTRYLLWLTNFCRIPDTPKAVQAGGWVRDSARCQRQIGLASRTCKGPPPFWAPVAHGVLVRHCPNFGAVKRMASKSGEPRSRQGVVGGWWSLKCLRVSGARCRAVPAELHFRCCSHLRPEALRRLLWAATDSQLLTPNGMNGPNTAGGDLRKRALEFYAKAKAIRHKAPSASGN
jgi:hypothetical protein